MSDRIVRLALMLALWPLAVAVFVGTLLISEKSKPGANMIQAATLATTLLVCMIAICTWRRFIVWTFPRLAFSLGSTAIVVGHVLLWAPIVTLTGCPGTNDALVVSQSALLFGCWAAGGSLVAWGRLLVGRQSSSSASRFGGKRMSPSIARMAIAMAPAPFCLGLLYGYPLVEQGVLHTNYASAMWRTVQLTVIIVVAVWLLLWRRQVVWTRRRSVATALLTALFLASPLVLIMPDYGDPGFSSNAYGVFRDLVGPWCPLLAAAIFIAGTAWAWLDVNPSARAMAATGGLDLAQLASCPKCGYSLKGLRDVRCPECGWSATVDELVRHICAELTDAA